jgi:hypothetical protein
MSDVSFADNPGQARIWADLREAAAVSRYCFKQLGCCTNQQVHAYNRHSH